MSIAEKLTSVAENVPKVYMAGATDFGLKGKAEGRLVTFNNVHPIEHIVNVKSESKNLFDYEDFVRRWDNGEYYESNGYLVLGIQFKPNTKYYLKANGTRGSGVVLISTKEVVNSDFDSAIGVSATWEAERAVTTDASGKIYVGATVVEYVTRELFEAALVQIEYGEAPTAYAPYMSDLSGVKVTVNGDNLFDVSKVPSTAVITNNEDGTITISGTYSARTGKTLSELCPALKVGEVVIFQIVSTGNNLIYLAGSNYTWNNGGTKVITEADLNSIVTLYGKSDSGTYTISQIWVSYGTTPIKYTEYVEPIEYIAKADGTVEGVRSISPVMNLSADAEGAIVSAECFLDTEAVVNELGAAIISIGGEI